MLAFNKQPTQVLYAGCHRLRSCHRCGPSKERVLLMALRFSFRSNMLIVLSCLVSGAQFPVQESPKLSMIIGSILLLSLRTVSGSNSCSKHKSDSQQRSSCLYFYSEDIDSHCGYHPSQEPERPYSRTENGFWNGKCHVSTSH